MWINLKPIKPLTYAAIFKVHVHSAMFLHYGVVKFNNLWIILGASEWENDVDHMIERVKDNRNYDPRNIYKRKAPDIHAQERTINYGNWLSYSDVNLNEIEAKRWALMLIATDIEQQGEIWMAQYRKASAVIRDFVINGGV